jgi:hypothetical protein
MGNGIGAGQGHIDQMLFAIGHAFLHGTDYITGFTDTDTNLAFLIADHHNGAKTELFTAFNYLGNAANLHHPLLPVGFLFLTLVILATVVCHASYPVSLRFSNREIQRPKLILKLELSVRLPGRHLPGQRPDRGTAYRPGQTRPERFQLSCSLSNGLTDRRSSVLGAAIVAIQHIRFNSRSRCQGMVGRIVDNLSVDMVDLSETPTVWDVQGCRRPVYEFSRDVGG